uniref:Leucine-rich repeat-containing N-terminal plant-type domain-containing protein n=1 Tax=Haptolina brevifila TaxID=156173 RepID=A0A7S2CKC7_9EUKA|mmetsp:Transcript_25994/g.52110  ORF Transcript_25994/g.52110 Transcript_25994/m.52110 type:complete len:465 (+) Transcript_25994:82-1476(+)|eukprot:CAMPEP_0174694458 /NCGR_PEP_ID=MMETSP1094-20130205/1054_1 /TAXON_ID=156173 /ORGANISM="Chrysochromulina brevifilum, Strain UTEX LB 985" /LENGTH=464 /DNA_ID=CAMNT_0015890711 /DNA_START=82 /DNA_END=1476 /DNA_ORIENTATION=+
MNFLIQVICAWLPFVASWAKVTDKEALVELYQSTGGANWTLSSLAPYDEMMLPGGNDGWDLSKDPCPKAYNGTWNGVGCVDPCYYPIDGDDCSFGRITGLQLSHNNLEGTIPDSLFDKLINLTVIDLSHNSLSGTIPTTIGKLRNLMVFQVGHNRLSGTIPTEIRTIGSHVPPDEMAISLADIAIEPEDGDGNVTYDWEITKTMGLSQFDVGHNNLNGTIPTTIGELANLQAADFSNNPELGADGCCDNADMYYQSFYGYNTTLPTEIGALKKLQVLKMDWSRFMRHLPTEVGNLRNLQYWRVQGSFETNQVSGTIPSQFGKLKKLTEFMMENNTLSGTLSNDLTAMESLEKFTVQDNKLSGSMPDDIGDLTALQWWDSFGNKLEGDLPSSIQNIGGLDYLYLQNEQLDPILSHFCRQRIEASAIGRKYNWQVLSSEYMNYKLVSACANPYDTHAAFEQLSGDV